MLLWLPHPCDAAVASLMMLLLLPLVLCRPVAGGGGGFKAPLTRMVCTPCYRAPEVVMSRGGYTGEECSPRVGAVVGAVVVAELCVMGACDGSLLWEDVVCALLLCAPSCLCAI